MSAFDRLAEQSPVLKGPVRQHYVSEFYLKGFAPNRKLAMYDRTTGDIQSVSPKKTAVLEHFYTFVDHSNRQRFELEAMFGLVESRAGTALKSVVSRLPLSFEDREYLALFVAMNAIRTPAALEESRSVREKVERAELRLRVSSEAAAYAVIKESMPADTLEPVLLHHAAKLFELVRSGHYHVDVPDEAARTASLKVWASIGRTLFERDWNIVHAPAGSQYITSDSPVVLAPLRGKEDVPVGYGSLHTRVLFPLSRTSALVMDGDARRLRHLAAQPEQVERFNAAVAADCYRYVLGSDAQLVRDTVSPLNLNKTRWAPRMDVGIGIPPGGDSPTVFIKGLGRRPFVPV